MRYGELLDTLAVIGQELRGLAEHPGIRERRIVLESAARLLTRAQALIEQGLKDLEEEARDSSADPIG